MSSAGSSAREEPVLFDCEGAQLVGVLHPASAHGKSIGVVIVVGGPQYRAGSHRQFVLLARALATSGYPVLRFDYRGMGDSDGSVRTFESIASDIRAAVDVLLRRTPQLSGIVLWGLCDAASAVSMYGETDSRIVGAVLVNPWVRSEAGEAQAYLKHYYLKRLVQGSFWRKIGSGAFDVRRSVRELLIAVRRARGGAAEPSRAGTASFISRMARGLVAFRGDVLVLLSERDLTAREFSDRCASDKEWRRIMGGPRVSVVNLAGADHTFSTRDALELGTSETEKWLKGLKVMGLDGAVAREA